MDIVGDFTFRLPQSAAWHILRDPKVLSAIVPICRDVRQVSDDRYTGVLYFRAGNMAGKFQGTIELFNIREPDSYDIKVQGNSPIGVVNVVGSMYLEPQADHTIMHYQGKIQFGGRIAEVGSRLLEHTVNSMMRQSFEALNLWLVTKQK